MGSKTTSSTILSITAAITITTALLLASGCLTANHEPKNSSHKLSQEIILNNSPHTENETMKILNLDIKLLGHSSVRIHDKLMIYIDPFQLADGPDLEKADIILVTHAHYDHCSVKDISRIVKPTTTIVTVADCQSKLSNLHIKDIKLVIPGTMLEIEGIKIQAVPAYNINKQFHPKENQWVGFIVEVDGVKVYHAGDTDLIPEMRNIETDIALLPVSGTYVMNPKEAAQATRTFRACKVAIPMHYGSLVGNASDAETFKQNAGCEVRILM